MAAITQPNNSYGKSPMRMLNKGSDLYSNTKLATPLSTRSNNRRKTATERLEADKFKYVKSEEVRQRRFTLELRTSSPPNNNDSAGSHSMGTESTGSPSNVEEDDGMEDVLTEDIITSMTGVVSYKEPKQKEPTVFIRSTVAKNSTTNSSPSERQAELSHSITANRRHQRMKNHAQRAEEAKVHSPTSPLIARLRERLANTSKNNTSPSPTLSIGTATNSAKQSSIDSPMSESASSQLGLSETKTPDSFLSNRNVMFAPFVDRNTRKPRSTTANDNFQSRRYRSASAGANVNRKIREMNAVLNENDKQIDPIMSPKTQLKHARDKLKKVSNASSEKVSSYSYNKVTNFQKFKDNSTFTVIPNRALPTRDQNQANLSTKPPIPKGKPMKDSNPAPERKNNEKKLSEVSKQSSEVNTRSKTNRSATNLSNRQSWDTLHESNNTQVLSSKLSNEEDALQRTKSSDKSTSSSSAPRQRKSWSKPPMVSSSTETKRNNRMSLPEDSMQPFRGSSSNTNNALWTKSGTRKSFAEALEDILNPVYESEHGNVTPTNERNKTASPDAISLTVVGGGSVTSSTKVRTRNSSIADNINSALGGTLDEEWSRQSNYSEMETQDISDRHDCNKHRNVKLKHRKSADNLIEDVWIRNYNNGVQNEASKENAKPSAASRLQSKSSQPYHCRQNSAPLTATQNHRDRRRQVGKSWDETKENYDLQTQESPKLAPRSRKEVLPDYSQKAVPTTDKMRNLTNENTLKSQNTTSSASADPNKPFTALTANDLKPRKNLQNVQSPSAPVKAMFAYPSNPAPTRQNPKRHTGPVSPTLSPHKQIPRLTPPQTPSRSSSSTPYSSLKRTPTSSRSSSLKRNHRHRRSDSGPQQSELDRFFSTMGMEESVLYNDSLIFSGNHVSSESDFSFAGASAYVRDSTDEMMELDPPVKPFSKQPQTVSIIEKNARVMRWLMTCRANNKKSLSTGNSPRHSTNSKPLMATQSLQSASKQSFESGDSPPVFLSCEEEDARPNIPPRQKRDINLHYQQPYKHQPPPIPPRTYMRHQEVSAIGIPKESDV